MITLPIPLSTYNTFLAVMAIVALFVFDASIAVEDPPYTIAFSIYKFSTVPSKFVNNASCSSCEVINKP